MKAWSRIGVRGLTYLFTGKGPLKSWLKKIGKSESDQCECGCVLDVEHVLSDCGDRGSRTMDEVWKDKKWCEEADR